MKIVAIVLLFTLLGCKSSDERVAEQQKIVRLERDLTRMETKEGSLERDISSLQYSQVQASNNNNRVALGLLTNSYLVALTECEQSEENMRMLLLSSTPQDLYDQMVANDDRSNYYSLLNRVKFVLTTFSESRETYPSTSANSKTNSEQFLFEYLGDCLGWGYFAYVLDDVIQEKCNTPQYITPLVDFMCARGFYILERELEGDIEDNHNIRQYGSDSGIDLQSALKYVLETTEEVNYGAEVYLDEYSTYEPKLRFRDPHYEKNWNGIQKFFFRIERNYPGSAKRIRENIRNYIL